MTNLLIDIRRNIITDLISLQSAWNGLEIINGSLFEYPEHWLKGVNGLVFADPPYPQEDRGVDTEKIVQDTGKTGKWIRNFNF